MELLTGKALADFDKWVKEYEVGFIDMEPSNIYVMYNDLNEAQQLPIIIEWLDSLGIYINTHVQCDSTGVCYNFNIENYYQNYDYYASRLEATKQAIIHANKIYNER